MEQDIYTVLRAIVAGSKFWRFFSIFYIIVWCKGAKNIQHDSISKMHDIVLFICNSFGYKFCCLSRLIWNGLAIGTRIWLIPLSFLYQKIMLNSVPPWRYMEQSNLLIEDKSHILLYINFVDSVIMQYNRLWLRCNNDVGVYFVLTILTDCANKRT